MESAGAMEESRLAVKTKKVARKKRAILEKMAKRRKTIKKKTVGDSPVLSGKVAGKTAAAVEDGSSDEDSVEAPQLSPHHLDVESVDGEDMGVQFSHQFQNIDHQDSREAGRELFRLLINPFPVDRFFK